jgi:hypothetical protein
MNVHHAVFFGVFLAAAGARADANSVAPGGRSLGVGVELGAPSSLNLKFMTASNQGIVVGVGGGIWYDLSLSLHADYLWHPIVAGQQ